MVEACRSPRGGVVAGIACLRKPDLRVIGIICGVVIGHVARGACRAAQVVVAVHMAARAWRSRVCAGQRETSSRVIKRAVAPCRRGVAERAVGRELCLHMVGVRRRVVVRHVAGIARAARQVVIPIAVALRALQVGVSAGQRESRGAVVEVRRLPRRCVVAALASRREIKCHVIGIRGLLVIGQMAPDARGWRVLELIVDVAGSAFQIGVCPGQRVPGIFQVIEAHAEPVVESVTLLAGGRKSGGRMAGRSRSLEIL